MTKKKADIFNLMDVPKLGPIGRKKLGDRFIFTKMTMYLYPPVEIADITGMTKEEAETAVTYCGKVMEEAGVIPPSKMSALELYERRLKIKYWSTGSKAVDELFGGGIEPGAVTEVSGKFGSGKTQMSHTLCTEVIMAEQEKGKAPNHVIYIDTEKTFRPDRIVDMIKARSPKADYKKLLGQITVQLANDAAHMLAILQNDAQIVEELNVKLIVIDSATGPFRQEYQAYGDQGYKFRKMNEFVRFLGQMAYVFDIPVIAVNQVYDSSDPFSPGQKIYGGNVWGHAMTYRAGLKVKRKGEVWVATTIDFPHRPTGDALFTVKSRGVTDIVKKEKKKD